MAKPTPAPAVRGRRPLIAGNWKMNCNHLEAIGLLQKFIFSLKEEQTARVDVAVLPPFTDLRSVQTLVEGDQLDLAYGAQDVSAHASGAHTGEIAASFLSRLGVSYVVIGHSERREHHHEDDALVAAKAAATLGAGMVPIVCVGEPLEVRREGRQVEHVLAQVDGSLAGLPAGTGEGSVGTVVIAYEPVWAIGTGEVATPDDAQEVCAAIRARLVEVHGQEVADAVRVLYGGSVKSSNVAALMTRPDVDGALVGGASLDADEFAAIARYQSHTTA